MLLKLLAILAIISLVAGKSVAEDNDRFIIVLHDEAGLHDIHHVMEVIETHEGKEREAMKMNFINNILPIVFANISKDTAHKVESLPEVKYIEADQLMYMSPIFPGVELNLYRWLEPGRGGDNLGESTDCPNLGVFTDRYNLDIMNKPREVCMDDQYNPPNLGTGARVYVLDTGINYDHFDFGNCDDSPGSRASYGGFDAIDPSQEGADCQGHGTHCAGIVGGLQSGVAKDATLLSIRVLGCTGSGSTSGIETAIDFVVAKHNVNKIEPDFVASIISMSLGGSKSTSFNAVVNGAVASGVNVVTASGNDGRDACNSSPGSAGDNINVGAHAEPVASGSVCKNPIAYFSNYGTCVDVVAPGWQINSAAYATTTGFTKMSGTSMACPHVAGAVALIMKNDRSLSPSEVKQEIKDLSVDDIDRSAESQPVRDASHSKRLYVPTSF